MADYEIQTQQQGNWVTQTTSVDKDIALATAKKLFGNKACTGVRVMQSIIQPDSSFITTEIMCETRMVKAGQTIRSCQIDWAPPPCTSLDEYYHTDTRRLMGRVLRDYCDKMVVTPTELLYCVKEALRCQDRGTLIPEAIDKVAAVQVADSADTRARAAEISQFVDQIISRARKPEKLALPRLDKSFAAAIAACKKIETQGEDPIYIAMSVLAKDLSTIRNWLGKLYRLCKLAEADMDNLESLRLLDGVIADCLAGAVVQDILGYQESLGQALIGMLDIAEGKFVPEKSDAGDAAGIITTLCAKGRLPASKQCLIDRVHRQLVTGGPLNRSDPNKEKDEFKRVVDRLVRANGLYCGPETADSITVRYGRMVEKGGVSGRIISFNAVFFGMPDRTSSIHYLCDILRTVYAEDCADAIAEKYDTIQNIRSFSDLCRAGMGIKERLQRLASARKAILGSIIPDAIKPRLVAHLDHLLDRFITEGQMLDKIDSPTGAVKDRAMALAQFCSSGILPPGKTLERFRERLEALISQPDFDARFVQGIADAAQAQKSLAALKNLAAKKPA